ncbi:ribosomal RNA small subunit methyltransferase A [Candidatus Uhrbacteria bacterium]|nr:ribosomal RNA small subunit methyltransferase A [Candidatus Uhrbacteria bacterium]
MNHFSPLRRRARHWGQHFLTDQTVLDGIMASADLKNNDIVLEIGPGKGVLTRHLLATGAQVVAIERDPRLVNVLTTQFQDGPRLRLVQGDALRVDWQALGLVDRGYVVVANIPYSITTPLIEKILVDPRPLWAQLMIQKDVALRLMARPGDPDRGALSVIVQEAFDVRYLLTVGRDAFEPPPAVESAVIRLDPRSSGAVDPRYRDFVQRAFRHRRKFLVSGLKQAYPRVDWVHLFEQTGIVMTIRPQELTNEHWKKLYSHLMESLDH